MLNKVFTESTAIVAVKPSGNVYCMQAVEELNVKPKSWRDLLTDEKFSRKDLIVIQDPLNLSGKELSAFHHVKFDLNHKEKKDEGRFSSIRNATADLKRTINTLDEDHGSMELGGGGSAAQKERALAKKALEAAKRGAAEEAATTVHDQFSPAWKPGAVTWNSDNPEKAVEKMSRSAMAAAAIGQERAKQQSTTGAGVVGALTTTQVSRSQTTGAASRSFTSSMWSAPVTANERAVETVVHNPTKKGYLRMHTSHGDVNLELHCDLVPRTCENFLALAKARTPTPPGPGAERRPPRERAGLDGPRTDGRGPASVAPTLAKGLAERNRLRLARAGSGLRTPGLSWLSAILTVVTVAMRGCQ